MTHGPHTGGVFNGVETIRAMTVNYRSSLTAVWMIGVTDTVPIHRLDHIQFMFLFARGKKRVKKRKRNPQVKVLLYL